MGTRHEACVSAIFFAPVLFAHSSWAASCWAMGLVVGGGWLCAAAHGTLGRIPLPMAVLAGWAMGRSLLLLWTVPMTGGMTMVAMGSVMIPYQVVPVMFQMGGVGVAVATVQWVSGWSLEQTARALTALRWTLFALVVLGLLQAVNLDQFNVYAEGHLPDVLGGTVGNPTLFAGVLAMSVPLWLTWEHRLAPWVAASAAGLIVWTSSITAVLAMLIAVWWVAALQPAGRWNVRFAFLVSGACVLGAMALWMRPDTMTYVSPSGRLEAWAALWGLWRATTPITGLGLGTVFSLGATLPIGQALHGWQHAHNEYLGVLVELGLIGVSLVGWGVWELAGRAQKLLPHHLALYGGVLLAASIVSLTSFPWHLAQSGFLILMAYSRIAAEGASWAGGSR